MKKLSKIFLVMFLLTFSVVGCESANGETCKELYCGKWSLIQIIQGFTEPEIFMENEIVWEFTSDTTLTVQINTDLRETSLNPYSSGKYTFTLGQEEIAIEDETFQYILTDDTLMISQDVASDGPEFTFKRVSL